jgi:DNA repair exonuclease SbcCD ATPase subunit
MGPPKGRPKRGSDSDTDNSTAGDDEEEPTADMEENATENVPEELPESAEDLTRLSNRGLANLNPELNRGLWERLSEERNINMELRKRLRQELDRVGRLRRDKLVSLTAKSQQVLTCREKFVKLKRDTRADDTRLKKRHLEEIRSKVKEIERLRSDLSTTRMDQAINFRAKNKAESKVKSLEREATHFSSKLKSKELDEDIRVRTINDQKKSIASLQKENTDLAKKLKINEEKNAVAKVQLMKMKSQMQKDIHEFKKEERLKKTQAVVFETDKKIEYEVGKAYIKTAVKESELQRKARALAGKVNVANQRIFGSSRVGAQYQTPAIEPEHPTEPDPAMIPGFPLVNRHLNPEHLFTNGQFPPIQTMNSPRAGRQVSSILVKNNFFYFF